MKTIFLTLLLFIFCLPALAQTDSLTQTVIGTVLDQQSGNVLRGATVSLVGTNPQLNILGTTDSAGNFKLRNVPIGRQTIKVNHVGYKAAFVPNIEVTSSKEVVIEIRLTENIQALKEVVIKSSSRKDLPINGMAVASTRQLSIEEANRYSGTRNDPSRMAQNFAGVSGANDGRNDIVIRGNSPTGVLWVMDGVDIPNPNHFSSLGSTGGPVSMLNTNTLKNSDFMTSAFPAQYGNAVAGVFDLRTRNGNTEKNEFLAEMGFNGIEFEAEGPLSKATKSSFLVDYRYSFVGLVEKAGLNLGTGRAIPYYQDGSFKLHIVTKKAGVFDWFGFGGESDIHLPPDSSATNLYAGNKGTLTNSNFKSITGVTGVTNTRFYNTNSSGKITLAVSFFQSKFFSQNVVPGEPDKTNNDVNDVQGKVSLGYIYNDKINSKNQLTAGITAELNLLNLKQNYTPDSDTILRQLLNVQTGATLVKGFANYNHRFNDQLSTNLGLYSQWFTLNNSVSIEPRFNLKYQFTNNQAFTFGAGLHSQMQPLEVYYYQTQLPNGTTSLTNKNLDFVKSLHTVAGYDVSLSDKVRFKTEVYGQYIFNTAVESTPSSFSMLNYGADFGFPDKQNLINGGKGYNYGLELTLEKFLNEGFYYLITGSIFDSRYEGSDGVWRNTAFDSNIVGNFLAGKEFKLSEKSSILVDTKFAMAGGQRYTPFDVAASHAGGYVIYKNNEAYSLQNSPYSRWDLKFSYQRNGNKVTQKWYIDLQNLTNKANIYERTLNPATGKIGQVNQIGFFPNINYQITF